MVNINIKEVAKISGVSVRTLHHYDQIGLLVPTRIKENDYREYSQNNLDALQQILLLRRCGFKLADIKTILLSPEYNRQNLLETQKDYLLGEIKQIKLMVKTIDKTILESRGVLKMSNDEKFAAFKERLLEESENLYGQEARTKYGNNAVEQSNKHYPNLSKTDFDKAEMLNDEILILIKSKENPKRLATAHRDWLKIMWGSTVPYSKEIHLNLINSYLADKRFIGYYNNDYDGVVFLKKAVEDFI